MWGHCGDLCARRVHKLGDLISKLSWLHFFESRFPWDRLIQVVNAFDLNYQGAISSRFHCAPIVVGAHPRRRQINSRSELPFNFYPCLRTFPGLGNVCSKYISFEIQLEFHSNFKRSILQREIMLIQLRSGAHQTGWLLHGGKWWMDRLAVLWALW